MPKPGSNTFDEDDLKSVVDEIDAYEAEMETIKAEAGGRCSAIKKKIKNLKKRANNELLIPTPPLNAALELRKKRREEKAIIDNVDPDYVEPFEDMCGQLSLFEAEDGSNVLKKAVQQRRDEVDKQEEREHQEGEKELNQLESLH